MHWVAPPTLSQGDIVAVVATARAVNQRSVENALEILSGWGLRVITGRSLFQCHQLFAGTDESRLQDLQLALDAPEVRAVFCARGGYGTTRIIDSIDWRGFQKNPKWICGFSDVTSLLWQVHGLGFQSIHSTMPQLFDRDDPGDFESLRSLLFSGTGRLEAAAARENRDGKARGVLIGGNLSLLVHGIGTPTDCETKGKILFLEEVDEYLYHLDRMMVQLKRAGKLEGLAGLMVGHLTKMKEGDLKFGMRAEGVIRSHLDDYSYPVAFGFPIGHDSPNRAVPMGQVGTLEVSNAGSLLRF